MRFLNPILVGALALASTAAFSQAVDTFNPAEGQGPAFAPVPLAPTGSALQNERNTLVTHPGAGAGGADESRLQNTSLAMGILGFGANGTAVRLADDFVIPAGGFTVTELTVYCYQTGSTTTSTFNNMTLQIWNGPPNVAGSTVVFGDTTTNRMSSTGFSNIFRVTETSIGNTQRPVMAITASGLNIPLNAGTYWADFSALGTLGTNAFCPAKTTIGQTATGNALQFTVAGATWAALTDVGAQGIPLTIDGFLPGADMTVTLADSPDPVTAGGVLTYTATASNAGPGPATDVAISLPLPAGTTFASNTATGATCTTPAVGANGTVTCTWAGATAVGTPRTMTVTANVAASATGTLNATATVSSATTDPTPGNNTGTASTTINTSADLSVALNASANAVPVNVPVTFTAVATNNGPSDAQNVVVAITLSPDFRYSSHTATGATCTFPQIGNSGVISCTWAGATVPGGTRTLSVVASSNNENNNTVSASVSSGTTDPNTANNSAAVSVTVGELIEEIPTLGQYALMLLGLLVGLIGFASLRRQA